MNWLTDNIRVDLQGKDFFTEINGTSPKEDRKSQSVGDLIYSMQTMLVVYFVELVMEPGHLLLNLIALKEWT